MAADPETQIRFESGQRTTGWQPFTFSRRSRVVLQGQANGARVEILLDSGAEKTVIDRRLGEALKLARVGAASLDDRRAVASAELVSGLELTIGALHASGLTAVVTDLAAVRSQTGLDVDVILGREIFEQTVIDIDFPGQRISFSHPEGFSPPPSATSTALRPFPSGHGRVIEVGVEDRTVGPLEFDLGSGSAVVLQQPFWTSARLTEGRVVSSSLIGTIGGIRETGLISLRSIELAGIRLTNVETVLAPSRGTLESRMGSGTIGMPVLSQFRLITDYTRQRLYLVPDLAAKPGQLPRNRSGLRVLQEGGSLRVLLVARHSPAEQAGWRAGERIVAIDGRPVDQTYWSSDLWRWSEGTAGTKVSLTLADGTRREIVLQDYF
ncbi:aspartyl protease family protein [Sphingomonas parva]|nr:aspartyl protease family protein [Sphingomonas parva]